jgi:hypothetical protein
MKTTIVFNNKIFVIKNLKVFLKQTLIHMRKIWFILIIIIYNQYSYSQEAANEVTQQYRIDYNSKMKLSEKLDLMVPVGFRITSPKKWSTFYAEPQIKYDWPRLILKKMKFKEQLVGGLGIYFTNNLNIDNRLEIRPFQGYSITAPNRKHFTLNHYLKLEERFEFNTSNWNNTFGLRLVYNPTATIKFQGKLWEQGKVFYIPISCEIFWNLIETKQFNDKFHFDFGLGKSLNKKWKVAALLGYNYSRQFEYEKFNTNEIIYRVRIYNILI